MRMAGRSPIVVYGIGRCFRRGRKLARSHKDFFLQRLRFMNARFITLLSSTTTTGSSEQLAITPQSKIVGGTV